MITLEDAYYELISRWRGLRSVYPTVSAPFLVEAPEHYWSGRRLLIVGQETCGWGEGVDLSSSDPEVYKELLNCYRQAEMGVRRKYTPFWQGAYKFAEALGVGGPPASFVWTNLVKCDLGGRRAPIAIQEALATVPVFALEVEWLRPEIMLCFTGPSLDGRLQRSFPGLSMVPVSKRTTRLDHPGLPFHSYRTDHPKYLRISRNWSALDELLELVG